ncbi:MAG: pyroglutamyl-peptidase I [Planctomycetota bacterium]
MGTGESQSHDDEILLTGFEPFGHTPHNPAESVARALDGKRFGTAEVVSRIVPNSFFESIDFVASSISELHPDIVVMMGEYGGRATITVERIAQNLNDSTRYGLQDNAGCSLQDQMTVPDGPAAYYATLPLRAMVKAMRDAGVPADISDAPGTFCCNHLMYGVLHHIHTHQLPIRAGWIHLPHLPPVAALPENLGAPSMSAEISTAGVEVGLRAVLAHPTDIDEPISSRLQI